MHLRSAAVAVAASVLVSVGAPVASQAGPPSSRGFGPAIEGHIGYDGQDKCDPNAKPGVLAFRAIVLRSYPGTGVGGISRACNIGGQSEHKEGRAWDWSVNVGVPYQRAAAESLLKWLTAEDRYGNEAAMAKRLGIMYIIWNRKIWGIWGGGWRTYCVQKSWGCKAPGKGGTARHPHTDHVHFSFTWDGAKKRTSYWHKDRSMLAGIVSSGSGRWILGRNGAVLPSSAGYYGSLSDHAVREPIVGMAPTPSGYGYWLLARDGKLKAYGDARHRGAPKGETKQAAGIVATPTGKGYWIYARGGRVFAHGDAATYGGLGSESVIVSGMAPTFTGLGYWLTTRDGRVEAFGDAIHLGDAKGDVSDVAGIVATPTGLGYWLYSKKGRVIPFGDASFHGGLAGKKMAQKIVGMARSTTGFGYWLLGDRGKIKSFGDAVALKSIALSTERLTPPQGLAPPVMPTD